MRILVLNWRDTAHPLAGGAEVYTDRVLSPWVARGDEVTWFAGTAPGLAPHEHRDDGIEIVRAGGRLGVYPAAWAWWHRTGRHRGYDLIIDEINSVPFGSPAYVGRPPVLALAHQTAQEIWREELGPVLGAIGAAAEPRLLRPYRHVPTVTVSSSSQRALAGMGLRDVTVLPQGTDPVRRPARLPATHGGPTLVWCGRLAPNKRPLHAIRAVEALRQRHPGAHLWIIGDGPQRAEVERAAALSSAVTVFGRVSHDERNARMAAADVLVATSVREGWGLTVSEAAELGTPAVGYRVAGLEDSIPASGGMLCDPDPRALASALTTVLSGRTPLRPRRSTVPWEELSTRFRTVADQVAGGGTRPVTLAASDDVVVT